MNVAFFGMNVFLLELEFTGFQNFQNSASEILFNYLVNFCDRFFQIFCNFIQTKAFM